MKKTATYHAARVAFLCGEEKVPWHLVCHALRQGLDLKSKIYTLQEKDYRKYPLLRELVEWLTGERTEESQRLAVQKLNEQRTKRRKKCTR